MPIASGAASRVDVGGDASTTWTPDGLRVKPKPTYKSRDSYLQRYEELKRSKKNKRNGVRVTPDDTHQSANETDGVKKGSPVKNGGGNGDTTGKPSSGERSKKSHVCVLL